MNILYKVYLKFYYLLDIIKRDNSNKNNKNFVDNKKVITKNKIEIYKNIKDNFLNELSPKTKLLVFLNARPHIFNPDRSEDNQKEFKVYNYFKQTWKNDANLFDPYNYTKKALIDLNKFNFPYLSYDCDAHYSPFGVKIYSDFVSLSFLKHVNNK